MAETAAAQSLDLRGKTITTFILNEAVLKLREMSEGDVLELVTERSEAIESDIGAWCRMTGHRFLSAEQEQDAVRYRVVKGARAGERRRLAFIISEPGLEELISPLGFALGAALAGIEVAIYFQGPAVKVLTRGFHETLGGLSKPFSGFARKGLTDIGHVPPQEKLRQLREHGAHFYICEPSMQHFGVEKSELIFDDVTSSEYVTFLEVLGKADIHFFLQ